MARVECEVEDDVDTHPDSGREIPVIKVTCGRCDHEVQCFTKAGNEAAAIKRCFVMLKEECPQNESNYYTADDERLE